MLTEEYMNIIQKKSDQQSYYALWKIIYKEYSGEIKEARKREKTALVQNSVGCCKVFSNCYL